MLADSEMYDLQLCRLRREVAVLMSSYFKKTLAVTALRMSHRCWRGCGKTWNCFQTSLYMVSFATNLNCPDVSPSFSFPKSILMEQNVNWNRHRNICNPKSAKSCAEPPKTYTNIEDSLSLVANGRFFFPSRPRKGKRNTTVLSSVIELPPFSCLLAGVSLCWWNP